MRTILIKNPEYLVTMDKKRRILSGVSLYIEDPAIKEVDSKKAKADKVIDARGMVVFPGFINTHLHILQVFHRHCPAQQGKPIAQWIAITTSINKELDEEAAYYGALICFAELMLSGVTTTADYFYPFPKGKKGLIEATVEAAKDIGIRLTSIRGSMSLSKKEGTLYDEDVVEKSEEILERSKDFIEKYHDSSSYSMIRIGIGPCLPFASRKEDFVEAAKLARKYQGVILQTHAGESLWEEDYLKRKYGLSPIEFMNEVGFTGPNVGLVHCNVCDDTDLKILAKTKTNVVVTPVCNTRDAADGNLITPLDKLFLKDVNVSLGTDGPASNDSLNMLEEMRYFRVVSPGKLGLPYLNPSQVFEHGTLNGAKTLNREDIGSLEVGKAADIVIFNPQEELSHAGAINPWGALISCQAIEPEYLIINGKVVIEKGKFTTINLEEILRRFRKIHKKIIEVAQKKLRTNLIDY